ncbi:Chemotaxis response regulator protein-glutamate methylesterase CheB [hydrothermal vent metagenome]|uniref:protein-glutamate methylesterase n=1 Tax=hydrothermal vent metagenome TaxID=652676 RepID=A0A3B0ZUT8_9ZZZZ
MATVIDVLPVRVVMLAASAAHAAHLRTLLETAGLRVVHSGGLDTASLQAVESVSADVLLVDLSEEIESEIELIDGLLEHSTLPIMFNDSSPGGGRADSRWAKRLALKLIEMVHAAAPVPKEAEKPAPFADMAASPREVSRPAGAAENVWVLGASLGGPQALRDFLAAVDVDLPVAFVLAQHIGVNHVQLLAEQLNRVSAFRVLPARLGHVLRHGEVILSPADRHLQLTEDGYVALTALPADAIYSPSINHVMAAMAERYGNRVGAVVFSGMGDDGAKGCLAVARQGGIVWAQDGKSCVISSMPDQARKTHTVTYSASPQAIARHLCEYYRNNNSQQ